MASNTLRNNWLKTLVRQDFFVADLRLALLTIDPDSGNLTEIDAEGYERREIEDSMSSPDGGELFNKLEIQFEPALENWPDIYGFALHDGMESEDPLLIRQIDSVRISDGDVLAIERGALRIRFEPEINVSFLLDVGNYNPFTNALFNPPIETAHPNMDSPSNVLMASSYEFDFSTE